MTIDRRTFLELTAAGGALAWAACKPRALEPTVEVTNPLQSYPNRDWETVYLDQYRYDDSFTWVCSPNCTHECRMRAFVRNGVMMRAEQNYDSDRIKDMDGNSSTHAWTPRGCSNGFTFQRRVYGPHRMRHPIIRRGWKEWADAGFPTLTPELRTRYKFDARGQDEFERVTWDQAFDYVAKGFIAVARTYSGDEGRHRLLEQGYPEEMLHHYHGAGTRTIKCRGGMGLLGVIGKYGMYRFANTLALLDQKIRGVGHEEARGGRSWSNYTWHGDQAPGHPFVHGVQTSDVDLNDMRFTKLAVHIGKNMIENKRADNHFFTEIIERGGRIVVVTPEYSPSGTKADYWIQIRPNTDAAFLLGVTRVMFDEHLYDEDFVKRFTDFPLLVRTDTLRRLRASDAIPDYRLADLTRSASFVHQGMTPEQRQLVGDFVVWDRRTSSAKALTRDQVGTHLGDLDPALEGRYRIRLNDGRTVECAPLFELYKVHLQDYDTRTVQEITGVPPELTQRLARDIGHTKPTAIHVGEGINHWFHATEVNRATYLPLMLTGNIGLQGSGSHTWAGNYKAGIFQGSHETGPGFKGWVAEDPFEPNLDPNADGKDIHAHAYSQDEEPAYWNYSDRPLIVETPRYGRRCFTGRTHMPTPSKALWFTNVNLINNAKWAYQMIFVTDPMIDMIVANDIEINGTVEYSDIGLPASSWVEMGVYEVTASCSNPFLQIWKGGLDPVYDTKDDVKILAGVAKRMGEILEDDRFAKYWKFALEGRTEVYIQRLLDSSTTARGYRVSEIMEGKYGEPGVSLFHFRTYPRQPFWEEVHDSLPFWTPTGRLQAYNDEPEVIEYGENFIVHREGPEATPYLPNVIVSSNPLIRPDDYGIPPEHTGVGERQVRNIRMPWSQVKQTRNPLWERGYRFYCVTPKTRHATHSSWQAVDWQFIWNNQYGDPYRLDQRAPGVGEHTLHINPRAARDLGINDGDYVYVDANSDDRPYEGWRPNDPRYRVARLMLRAKYNPSYPYEVVMMKHAPWIATERSVRAHETRPDGRALSAGTGYQAMFRYGSQQSITRGWLMPMHQTDSLFHKAKAKMGFIVGGEADNHAVNTTPKETLVKITKAEDGGLGGRGQWAPNESGFAPAAESEAMVAFLAGDLTKVRGA